MDKTLEEFFEWEGWVKWETTSHGRVYIVWRKHGFEIDEDDITDNWGTRRKTTWNHGSGNIKADFNKERSN